MQLSTESVLEIERYSLLNQEYAVQLTNGRRLVVRLNSMTCTCKRWQMQGFPCCHALAVISKANLWVYDYVSVCYKSPMQQRIYTQAVHPLETHDMPHVDDGSGNVVGGEDLDDGYNRRIFPPMNAR